MSTLLIVEIISVVFNIVFLVLLTKEKKQCWIYGIIGSLLGAYVFFKSEYFSETILYVFYTIVGVYGYLYWDQKNGETFTIKRSKPVQIILLLIGTTLAALGLGYIMSKTSASKPYFDALSTAFGVVATFLELYKYYVSWTFWIFINLYTIWLYGQKELNFFMIQMSIYTVLSIYGLYTWHLKLKEIEA